MKSLIHDPKLTAYALGELSDAEADQMRRSLESDEEARQFVEDLQATARILTDEYRKEPTVLLKPAARAKLVDLAEGRGQWWKPLLITAAAAVAVVAIVGNLQNQDSFDSAADRVAPAATPSVAPTLLVAQTSPAQTGSLALEEEFYSFEKEKLQLRASKESSFGGAGSQEMMIGKGAAKGHRPSVGEKVFCEKYGCKPSRIVPFEKESYTPSKANEVVSAKEQPRSTFSADVDTASYSNVRRMLIANTLPPKESIRTEEMLNSFSFEESLPAPDKVFSIHGEVAKSPWNEKALLMRLSIKGKEMEPAERPPANLVFLMDVSGSMNEPNKLPLVKSSLLLLLEKLRSDDRVAVITYANTSELVLDSTAVSEKAKIKAVIENLRTSGASKGGAGIQQAYQVATKNFIKEGVNRVVLVSDGDFNAGMTSESELVQLIEREAKSGVFLTVLGFGQGNLKDSNLQKLANKGNGQYAYIDRLREAEKVLVEQTESTLVTIAKDVKVQVEFQPSVVSQYRLMGYEKRVLDNKDFQNDQKDAGDVGAGHTVTVFYEIFPGIQAAGELAKVKLHYKLPTSSQNEIMEISVAVSDKSFASASSDFKFGASVVQFAEVMKKPNPWLSLKERKSGGAKLLGEIKEPLDQVIEIASANTKRAGKEDGYRLEFVELVKKARFLRRWAPAEN